MLVHGRDPIGGPVVSLCGNKFGDEHAAAAIATKLVIPKQRINFPVAHRDNLGGLPL